MESRYDIDFFYYSSQCEVQIHFISTYSSVQNNSNDNLSYTWFPGILSIGNKKLFLNNTYLYKQTILNIVAYN